MVKTRTGETDYTISGEGPWLVLVHGLGMRREMWAPLLPALERHYKVLTYDLGGHGLSPPPADPVTLRSFSEQLLGLMDDVGIARAPLVGFSLGGMIVRRLAMDHPEHASALVVIASPHGRTEAETAAVQTRVDQATAHGPAATIDAAIERWFNPAYRDAHPEAIALIRRAILANDPKVYPKIYQVLVDGEPEVSAGLAAIRLPLLVLTGDADPGNTVAMAQGMAACVPGAELKVFGGLRHMGIWENPDTFTGAMLDFLKRRVT
ncbi:MAG: alpha/beta fold hydrolase [Hyphomicrobiaceae bacterium]